MAPPPLAPEHPDRAIAALAARQHGRVNRQQLLAAGLSSRQISARAAAGRLVVEHAGVYAVGHASRGARPLCASAVLAYAPGAAIGFVSSAALRGLRRSSWQRVDVVLARHGRTRRPGIRVHRTEVLLPGDVEWIDGIPVTSVPRTYVDCASVLSADAFSRLWREGIYQDVLDAAALAVELDRGRAGTAAVRAHLADPDEVPVLRSELEERAWRLIRRERLGRPQANLWLPGIAGGIEVDLLWPEHRLVVELDGWRVHGTFAAFHADRSRDAQLQLAGYRVVRLTWRDVTCERAATARLLRAFLAG